MEANCSKLTERILQLTLEIIYLLTGEDNIVAKKTSGNGQNCVMVPLRSLLIPPGNDEQKILEVTKKMMELLTGEVPIRCQDVAVYLSMEEWEYLEGHKELYKDVMMASQPALISPDGSSNGNPPERCPRPLYSQDSTQEDLTIPHHHRGEEVFEIKTEIKEEEEEIYVGKNQLSMMEAQMMVTKCKEESILDDSAEHNIRNTSEGGLILSSDYTNTKEIAQYSPGVSNVTQNVHSDLNDMERSTDGFNSKELKDKLHTIISNVQPSFKSADRPPDPCNPDESSSPSSDLVVPKRIHANKNRFSCSQCEKTFIKKSNFIQHQRVHTGEKPFSCPECGKDFPRKENRDNHMRTHTGEKPFSCSECGKGFSSKEKRDNHIRTHTGEKPFSCDECGKGFSSKEGLYHHMRIHNGEKRFSCSECGMGFSRKLNRDKHMITHTGESLKKTSHTGQETLSCHDCDKVFITVYDLVLHRRSHSGEVRFSCTECKRSFKYSYQLVEHQRIHTREKHFPCSVCGKSYTQNWQLKTHQMVHTGEKPFSCSECSKCFSRKGNRDKHMKLHTREKPFSCPKCGKCFAQKVTLIIHLSTHKA